MTADRTRLRLMWAGTAIAVVVMAAWTAGAYRGGTDPGRLTEAPPPTGRALEAEAFWREIGGGDEAAAAGRLDPSSDPTLRRYAGFAAGLETGLEPETCRTVDPGIVRCSLRTTDPEMLALYAPGTAEYASSSIVRFGEEGIVGFTLPGLFGGVSQRLLSHARRGGGIPEECVRANHDSLDLPPYSTTLAQTGPCAEALAALIPAALGRDG